MTPGSVMVAKRAALDSGDGLSGRVNGQPPLPTRLARLLAPLVVTPSGQAKELRATLGVSEHPQLMVRFGHATRGPYSLRRSVDEVLVG